MLSVRLTEALTPQEDDYRRPLSQWEIDVAAELDSLTKDVSQIPNVLADQMKPRYEGYKDQEKANAQMELTKKALYAA